MIKIKFKCFHSEQEWEQEFKDPKHALDFMNHHKDLKSEVLEGEELLQKEVA